MALSVSTSLDPIYAAIEQSDLEKLEETLQPGGLLRRQLQIALAADDPTCRQYGSYEMSPLHFAIKLGRPLEILEALIHGGDDVNTTMTHKNDGTVTHIFPCIAEMYSGGDYPAFVECVIPMQYLATVQLTPLARALGERHSSVEKLGALIHHGANLRFKGNCCLVVASILAAWDDPSDCPWDEMNRNILWALEQGASLTEPDEFGNMPLVTLTLSFLRWIISRELIADVDECSRHLIELLGILVNHGADVRAVETRTGNTILHMLLLCKLRFGYNFSLILAFFLERFLPLELLSAKNMAGLDPFACAIQITTYYWELDSEILRKLLEHGADPTKYRGKQGITALHVVVEHVFSREEEKCAVIEMLLDCGMDVDVKNNLGETPLMYALRQPEAHVFCAAINCLLQHGANYNAQDSAGRTPMHTCCSLRGNLWCLELLVEYGANLKQAIDNSGNTLLHEVTSVHARETMDDGSRTALVKYLVDAGVNCGFSLNALSETPLSQETSLDNLFVIVRFGAMNAVLRAVRLNQ